VNYSHQCDAVGRRSFERVELWVLFRSKATPMSGAAELWAIRRCARRCLARLGGERCPEVTGGMAEDRVQRRFRSERGPHAPGGSTELPVYATHPEQRGSPRHDDVTSGEHEGDAEDNVREAHGPGDWAASHDVIFDALPQLGTSLGIGRRVLSVRVHPIGNGGTADPSSDSGQRERCAVGARRRRCRRLERG
jgi:hypothetical protein